MLTQENFTETHIRALQNKYKRDPALLERAVYAFGLLEAITRAGMPFVFKGGSCLMLLMEYPRRLSTDIDIVVEPGTPVDEYIQRASVIFPFIRFKEHVRVGINKIEKRHFQFTYDSPINRRDFYILLDVVFEENHYALLDERTIRSEFLITGPEYMSVKVPGIDCILGDKLTAFAPHTTGIPVNAGKDMEVMKQFDDICALLDVFTDFDLVYKTYEKVAASEIAYRGSGIELKEAMEDIFWTAVCIASRGKIRGDEYPFYIKGARDLRNHIFVENYSPEKAAVRAAKVLYMAACLMTETVYTRVVDYTDYTGDILAMEELSPLRYLRKASPESFAYVVKGDQSLRKNKP